MRIIKWFLGKDKEEPEFDRTQINSLLSLLLDSKSTEQTLELKELLDLEFTSIMEARLEARKTEIENIKNYLK